jgi:hypothetical protein
MIGFNEATSSDCNVGDPAKLEWLASELRYYDDSPRYKDTYELLCVSEFKSAGGAVQGEIQFKLVFGSHLKRFAAIPGVYFVQVGPATEIIYSKGLFSVFVASVDVGTGNAVHLGEVLAAAEYHKLPT